MPYNQDNYIRLLVTVGVLAALVVFLINGLNNLTNVTKMITTAMSVALIFHLVFTKYLWKLKFFRLFITKVPNLEGTWIGKIYPVGNDTIKEIDAKLYITQTFSKINVELQTSNMKSNSYLAGFCVNEDTKSIELCYLYNSKSLINQRESNPWHEGSTKLEVLENGIMMLKGEYWTSRKTVGEIRFSHHSKLIIRE